MSQELTLIVQPDDGVAPIAQAIDGAKTSLDILIFRFDRRELESALIRAVERGVRVRALIAHTNRGGDKTLRSLEMRLLKAGITVARTADDLLRYHGKLIIVDGAALYLLGFNFTYLDIDRSRSFGVIVRDKKLVAEAAELFESDCARQPFTPANAGLLVSPLNARQGLAEFLKDAAKELLIYDPNVSDSEMGKILRDRAEEGVTVRVIGSSTRLPFRRLNTRLHVRLIIRDGKSFFLGSQSLRGAELDKRREIGAILESAKLAARLREVFEADWERAEAPAGVEAITPARKIAKKVAKAVTKELPPMRPIVAEAMKAAGVDALQIPAASEKLEETVAEAVKDAVKEAVQEAVESNG
jgi:phosphatidylserine/phosphatidylglycerophosphate/cardiolipin synthase-like enzyme